MTTTAASDNLQVPDLRSASEVTRLATGVPSAVIAVNPQEGGPDPKIHTDRIADPSDNTVISRMLLPTVPSKAIPPLPNDASRTPLVFILKRLVS